MPSATLWERILRARTTSEAIELAVLVPVSELTSTPLPVEFSELSNRARLNLLAVNRSFEVTIGGVEDDGWKLWNKTSFEREVRGIHNCESHLQASPAAKRPRLESEEEQKQGHKMCSMLPETSTSHRRHRLRAQGRDSGIPAPTTPAKDTSEGTELTKECNATEANVNATAHPNKPSKLTQVIAPPADKPSPAEFKCVETVKDWALHSPHTSPPSEALRVIGCSACAALLLNSMIPEDATPTFLAAVIGSFSESVGSGFAGHLMEIVIGPFVLSLKVPASREVMQAIEKFSGLHWRAAIDLFKNFDKDTNPVTGPIAEVLVRVGGTLNGEAALQALRFYCKCSWGEAGIRVVEELMLKCKEDKELASILVPALESNVIGSEKSVRFGKLLFTAVKDLPGLSDEFVQAMESVIARSKVFLAKRARTLLQSKSSTS